MSSAVLSRPVHVDDPNQLIHTENRDGVLLATIDMPGRTMNVFSWALMDALERLIERISTDDAVTSVVLTSGKSSFLAGADLDMVSSFTEMASRATPAEVHHTTGRLGRLFVRLEALPKPTVAAITGLAFGGGLEIAMACSYRIAPDDPRVQLGLPEIKLGLLPGGGGTQRMPRLIGIEKAIELLLNGRSVAPREALKLGLINEVVAREELVSRALVVAAELSRRGWHVLPQKLDAGPFNLADPNVVRRITEHFGYSDETVTKYPAYHAIVRAVVEGADLPIEQGDDNEMARFVDLMYDETRTAANMVRTLFLNRQLADKVAAKTPDARDFGFSVQAGEKADTLSAAFSAANQPIVEPAQVRDGDVVIVSADKQAALGSCLVWLAESENKLINGNTGICLKGTPQYGFALEIVQSHADDRAKSRALVLARRLRATPFVHFGTVSLLAKLASVDSEARAAGLDEEGVLLAQALAASRLMGATNVEERQFADVVSVVSGVFPAFTGGPFTFLRLRGDDRVAKEKAAYALQAPHLFI